MRSANTTLMARGVCVALAMAGCVAARAQATNDSNLDVTIRLLPENAAAPADITRQIQLPPAAANPPPRAESNDGDDAVPPGQDKAKERGADAADEARERGREFGQDTAEQARGNRENAGRPDDAPGRGPPDPDAPPGPRGRPETPPGQPENPPGRPETPPGRP